MKHPDEDAFRAARAVGPRPLSLSLADLLEPPKPLPRPGGWLEAALSAETRVMTPEGPIAAGLLRPGAMVLTLDDGAQPVLWAGRCGVTAAQIRHDPGLGPVRVAASAFGPGLPRQPLRLSPRAGVLRPHPAAPEGTALVAAMDLTTQGVGPAPTADIAYVQLVLPVHGLIGVEGIAVETLHPARIGEAAADAALRAAIAAAVPGLDHGVDLYGPEARARLQHRQI